MATPYGHTLAGLTLLNLWYPQIAPSKRREWFVYGLVALGASFPDLDFIPGLILGQIGRFHHGFFHSLGVAIGAALIAGILIKVIQPRSSFMKTGSFVLGLGISHLFLDFFTESPFGFPLFWPFAETKFLSPLPVFPRVAWIWEDPVFWTQALFCFSVESVLLLPLWIISWRRVTFPK